MDLLVGAAIIATELATASAAVRCIVRHSSKAEVLVTLNSTEFRRKRCLVPDTRIALPDHLSLLLRLAVINVKSNYPGSMLQYI
ncbi:hypothetical protein OG21DRAFT_407597 [Imleria badia]|nr:hypothetical protein OG21DRAFT_407597 [Imleria badia]